MQNIEYLQNLGQKGDDAGENKASKFVSWPK